jgi:hypothetical protein
MKKISLIPLCLFLALIALSSCAKTPENTTESKKRIDIRALAAAVIENVKFTETPEPLESEVVKEQFSVENINCDAVAYVQSSAVSEIFAAFSAQNEADAQLIENAVYDRIDYLRDGYSSYGPAEVPKIDSAVVIRDGTAVIFCISADNAEAKTFIENYIK